MPKGLFVPTTPMFDVGDLQNVENLKELVIRLTQSVNNISIALNLKDTGYYVLEEYVNGQLYFPNPTVVPLTQSDNTRQVFRKVIDFGALPNAGLKAVPHGIPIDATYSFTRIYATASDPVNLNYIPIPSVSLIAVANNIQIVVDATDVIIGTAVDFSAFTICYVVLEYIKQ